MTNKTIAIFIAGDLHIPSRASMFHPKFDEILRSKKWDYIVLTGDLTQPNVLHYFKEHVIKPENLIVCRGNMDLIPLPVYPTFDVSGIRFGVFHGTGIHPRGDIKQLKEVAKEKNVRILFTGHSHLILFHIDNEHILLNPGTSTGASGGSSWTVNTGVMILSIYNRNEIEITYHYINNFGRLKTRSQLIIIK
ncbi:MAG: YfcE family phosphodiesterase [Candidatus Heimdallarchaeota archaeon]